MRLFGVEISFRRTKKDETGLQGVEASRSGRGWRTIFDHRPGAWQMDMELPTSGETTNALQVSPVIACVRLIAGDISKMGLCVYRLIKGVWQADKHQVFSRLFRKPNSYQTCIDFLQCWLYSLLLSGNTYVFIARDEGNKVTGLFILDPTKVTVLVSPDGAIFYRVGPDPLSPFNEDEGAILRAEDVIHHRYLPLLNPLIGVSPLIACGDSARVIAGMTSASAELHENNAVPPGILWVPEGYSEAQMDRIADRWNRLKQGRTAVLENTLKFESLQVKYVDNQAAEIAKYSAQDICMAFNVPPWKLDLTTRPGGDNPEAAEVLYYTQTIQPLVEHIEELLDVALEIPDDVAVMCDTKRLFRMDSKTRAERLVKLVGGMVMAPNEARAEEDLPEVPGGNAVFGQQQNYSLSELEKQSVSKPTPTAAPPPGGASGLPGKEGPAEPKATPPAAGTAPPVPWMGVYSSDKEYSPGVFVTHEGALWYLAATPGLEPVGVLGIEPGTDSGWEHGWRLAVKRGGAQ